MCIQQPRTWSGSATHDARERTVGANAHCSRAEAIKTEWIAAVWIVLGDGRCDFHVRFS